MVSEEPPTVEAPPVVEEAISNEELPTLTPIKVVLSKVPVLLKVVKDKNGKTVSVSVAPKKPVLANRFNF